MAAVTADAVLPQSFAALRVLVVHDWLVTWAGAERCVEQILQVFPQADLVVGLLKPDLRNLNQVTRRAQETWLARLPGAQTHHRWLLPLEGVAFSLLDTKQYDLIISSSHAFAKSVRPRNGALHICYCYTPPRYLWDLQAAHRDYATALQRVALVMATGLLRRMDLRAAGGVDHFIAISEFVSDRIRRWYNRSSDVVYPPVAPKTEKSVAAGRGEFLLCLGRLVPYKRIDLAIEAAKRLGLRLVVAGDGPDRRWLERLGGRRTEFVGAVSETEAARLLSTCRAFLFCGVEDFGIVPVEANAHGTPVVAYAGGGVLESMVPGVTAELFEDQTVSSLEAAIRRALDKGWDHSAIRQNAARFAPTKFRSAFTAAVTRALGARSSTGHPDTRRALLGS